MSDFKLDPLTHDLVIEDGDTPLITGSEALLQRISITLGIIKGEWFADTLVGIPYVTLFSEKDSKDFIDAYMKGAIGDIEGVRRILEYDSELERTTRNLTITYTVLEDDGTETEGSV